VNIAFGSLAIDVPRFLVAGSNPLNFDPLSIPDASWWIDVDDGTTVTLTASPPEVESVEDKVTGASTARLKRRSVGDPGPDRTLAHGRNWLDYDGTTKFLEVADPNEVQVNFGAGEFTIFATVRRDYVSTATRFAVMTKGNTTRYIMVARQNFDGDGTLFDSIDGDTGPAVSIIAPGGTLANGGRYVLRMTRDNAAALFSAHVNGTSMGTAVSTTGLGNIDDATQKLLVGCSPNAALTQFHWEGLIGEVLFYDRALNATEVADVESYLTAKWLA